MLWQWQASLWQVLNIQILISVKARGRKKKNSYKLYSEWPENESIAK